MGTSKLAYDAGGYPQTEVCALSGVSRTLTISSVHDYDGKLIA
jgi:hypothetical protein